MSDRFVVATCGRETLLWDVRAAKEIRLASPGTALALSSDDRWLAVGGDAGVVELWDLAARALRSRSQVAHLTSEVTSLAFDRLGNRLLVGSVGSRIHVADVRSIIELVEMDAAERLFRAESETGYVVNGVDITPRQ